MAATQTVANSDDSNVEKKENVNDKFMNIVTNVGIENLDIQATQSNDSNQSVKDLFTSFKTYLISMSENGRKEEDIISFVVDCIGAKPRANAILFVTRLIQTYPKQMDNNLKTFLDKNDNNDKDLTRILNAFGFISIESIAARFLNSNQFVSEAIKRGIDVPLSVNGPIGELFVALHKQYRMPGL